MTDIDPEVAAILKGIDREEIDDGWWETSVGAEFGATKLAEISALVGRLRADGVKS